VKRGLRVYFAGAAFLVASLVPGVLYPQCELCEDNKCVNATVGYYVCVEHRNTTTGNTCAVDTSYGVCRGGGGGGGG
jgi:hypothetical protein